MAPGIRLGINPTSIGVSASWWLETVRQAEEAGFDSAWIWDHFVSRGRRTDPVLECWTLLATAAGATEDIRLGSFVTNVMNRHPAVLARMAASVAELSGGRLELGIGIGGHPAEHVAYGIDFPDALTRGQHLDEAVSVLRLLLAGGPADYAGRHYQLEGAHAFPAPVPPPRIVVAGTTPAGARRAARIGDAWTCFGSEHDRLRPIFREALSAAGRDEAEVPVIVAVEVEEILPDPGAVAEVWAARGVSELIVHAVRKADLPPLLEAVARSGAFASGPGSDALGSDR
ncbi:LLM class F420-dependent oxidoreductase [soil metagenome]